MEKVSREIQEEAIVVLTKLHARQAETLKGHGAWLTQHDEAILRVTLALAELAEKLNALVGVVNNMSHQMAKGAS